MHKFVCVYITVLYAQSSTVQYSTVQHAQNSTVQDCTVSFTVKYAGHPISKVYLYSTV